MFEIYLSPISFGVGFFFGTLALLFTGALFRNSQLERQNTVLLKSLRIIEPIHAAQTPRPPETN